MITTWPSTGTTQACSFEMESLGKTTLHRIGSRPSSSPPWGIGKRCPVSGPLMTSSVPKCSKRVGSTDPAAAGTGGESVGLTETAVRGAYCSSALEAAGLLRGTLPTGERSADLPFLLALTASHAAGPMATMPRAVAVTPTAPKESISHPQIPSDFSLAAAACSSRSASGW